MSKETREVEMKEKIYTIPVNEAFEKQDGLPVLQALSAVGKKRS